MTETRVIPVVVALLAIGTLLIAGVIPVSAHAHLSDSDPANGEQLEAVPEEISLSFTGDGVQVATVEVTGPDGEDGSGNAEVSAADRQVVTVPLDEAGDGVYVVDWEVLADDGHTTSGTFFFVVGDEPIDREAVLEAHDGDIEESVSWLEAAANGLVALALAVLIGAPLTALVAFDGIYDRKKSASNRKRVPAFDRRMRLLIAGETGLLFLALVVLGISRIQSLGSLSIETGGTFLGTSVGQAWLLQLGVATVLTGVGIAILRDRLSRSQYSAIAIGGGLVIVATVALNSHSATAIDRSTGWVVHVGHLLGLSLWVGGLTALALTVPEHLTEDPQNEQRGRTALRLRRCSVLFVTGATVVLASGLVLASWHAGTVDGLTGTLYGNVLVAKLGLLTVALVLGGYHRFVTISRLDPHTSSVLDRLQVRESIRPDGGQEPSIRPFQVTVRIELVILVCLILLSGVLTATATATVVMEDEGLDSGAINPEFEADIDLEVTALPVEMVSESQNRFFVAVEEPVLFEVTFERGGEPLQSDRPVELLMTDGETTTEVELEADEGLYSTVQPFPSQGAWELRITASPDGSFASAWFDLVALPDGHHEHHDHDGEDDAQGDDAVDHESHGEHDHSGEQGQFFDDPIRVASLLVLLYGGLAVGYETWQLRRRASLEATDSP